MNAAWVEFVGYAGVALGLTSMCMTSLLRLRGLAVAANTLLCGYGLLIEAMPIVVASAAAVIIHSVRAIQLGRSLATP